MMQKTFQPIFQDQQSQVKFICVASKQQITHFNRQSLKQKAQVERKTVRAVT